MNFFYSTNLGDFKIAKLCDFGSTVPLDSNGNMKQGYDFEGTELWMAAECFDEDQTITTRADIFPLGLVIWEMITLQVPFMDMDMSCATDTSFMDLSNIPYGNYFPFFYQEHFKNIYFIK